MQTREQVETHTGAGRDSDSLMRAEALPAPPKHPLLRLPMMRRAVGDRGTFTTGLATQIQSPASGDSAWSDESVGTPRPFFVLTLVASWAAGAMVWSAKHASGRQDPLRAVSASGGDAFWFGGGRRGRGSDAPEPSRVPPSEDSGGG